MLSQNPTYQIGTQRSQGGKCLHKTKECSVMFHRVPPIPDNYLQHRVHKAIVLRIHQAQNVLAITLYSAVQYV